MNLPVAVKYISWACLVAIAFALPLAYQVFPFDGVAGQIAASLSLAARALLISVLAFNLLGIFPAGASAGTKQSFWLSARLRCAQVGWSLYILFIWADTLCRACNGAQPIIERGWISQLAATQLSDGVILTALTLGFMTILSRPELAGTRFAKLRLKSILMFLGLLQLIVGLVLWLPPLIAFGSVDPIVPCVSDLYSRCFALKM
jgi:hypothetical protein